MHANATYLRDCGIESKLVDGQLSLFEDEKIHKMTFMLAKIIDVKPKEDTTNGQT